ncbi:hypothetical protein ACFYZ9_23885 [Streptomyces sp. NPDC001691]|uniref:hypothetical protein n=1 Tax=Streptomyces sp. NPDC001691 TaxID=3364600 RepID=UPI0036CAC756
MGEQIGQSGLLSRGCGQGPDDEIAEAGFPVTHCDGPYPQSARPVQMPAAAVQRSDLPVEPVGGRLVGIGRFSLGFRFLRRLMARPGDRGEHHPVWRQTVVDGIGRFVDVSFTGVTEGGASREGGPHPGWRAGL